MTALPAPWTQDWLRARPVLIKFRRGEGFKVKPEYEAADGRLVQVHMPRIMESAKDGGHSLYAGQACWDVVDRDPGLPIYLCEADFEWVDLTPRT